MNRVLLLLFIACLFVTGCSSQKFYTIEPAEKEFDYYEGRKVLIRKVANVDVYMNYEYRDHDNFVFYMFAVNNSEDRVTIDPSKINTLQSGKVMKEVGIRPLNPEVEIELIRKGQAELNDSHAANVGMNCLFATFDVVADIADGEGEEAAADAGYWVEEMEYEQDGYEYESNELAAHKLFWENEALRFTTLYPDEEVGGLIFVPVQHAADRINFLVEVNNTIIVYRFLQKSK